LSGGDLTTGQFEAEVLRLQTREHIQHSSHRALQAKRRPRK